MKLSTILALTAVATMATTAIAGDLLPERMAAFEQPVRNSAIKAFGSTPGIYSAKTAFPRLVPDDGREYNVIIEEDFSLMTAGSPEDPDRTPIEGDYFMIPSKYTRMVWPRSSSGWWSSVYRLLYRPLHRHNDDRSARIARTRPASRFRQGISLIPCQGARAGSV